MITSAANARLKLARSVKEGREPGLIFIEGERLAEDAVLSGLPIQMAFHIANPTPRAAAVLERLAGVELLATEEKLLSSLADTTRTQGLILIAKRPETQLEQACAGQLTVVLDAVQDPGNVGTLMRTAEAAGATGMVLLTGTADPWSPKVLRSAMGSAFRLPLAQCGLREFMGFAESQGIRLIVTTGVDAMAHTAMDWTQRCALILGNEGNGVCTELLQAAGARVCIPMAGAVESLNVATAGAVLLFEAARQRAL
jgi:RNA methyltransferase, TrmH family